MGIVRATISHPFEILKLKSQTTNNIISNNNINNNNINKSFYKNLFKGLHYSVISNSLERGIQFGMYEKFKQNDNILMSSIKSSLISTSVSLPYNILLLKKVILSSTISVPKNILYKSAGLEYSRNLFGSTIFLSSYNYFKEHDVPILLRAPIASFFVWGITYPLDSYKNILIANNNMKEIKDITIKNLYKGIQYPIIRSIPSSIAGFYVYEYMLKLLNQS
jgi:hypothetical protein